MQKSKPFTYLVAISAVLLSIIILPRLVVADAGLEASLDSDNITSEERQAQIESLSKGNPKLDSALNRLAEEYETAGPAPLLARIAPQSVENTVRVIIEGDAGHAEEITGEAGDSGIVEASYGDLVQMVVPVSRLTALADMPSVRFVRKPQHPLTAVISQGVNAINADDWLAASYNGTGVKIGVLDIGFSGYAALRGSELPASITTHWATSIGNEGDEVHGTACAEIIYDIAPAASYCFANFSTEVEYGNAVEWLVSQGVDIISCSVAWPTGGPGDGTGMFCQIVDYARDAGVLWVQAVGNQAQRHWQGAWSNPNASPTDVFHNFSGDDEGNTITASAGDPIVVALKWDDPWYASNNDYDLLLFDNAPIPNIVAYSLNIQDGDDDPWEFLAYIATYSGTYDIAIGTLESPAPVDFHIYSYYHDLQYQTTSSSFLVPADSFNALAVGAVDYSNPGTLESFSSRGPTDDGRIKPDLVATDNVSTQSYSPVSFSGTSASTPHVAGAAALVKQRFPSYSAARIQSFLEGRAFDLGSAGKDNLYGSGRINLGSASSNFTLTMAVSGSGNVTPAVGTHSYPEGTTVNITATAAAAWQFVKWTGGVADPDSATTNVTIDIDKTITAYFINIMNNWSNDPNVNTPVCTTAPNQSQLQIVSDGSGGAILTWQDAYFGDYDIYTQYVEAQGNILWDADGVAVGDTVFRQEFPQIVSDGCGGAIVTWAPLGIMETYAQRIDASGINLWTSSGIIIGAGGRARDPQIVIDGSGGAIITWWKDDHGSILAQRIDASGNKLWNANGVAISASDSWKQLPQIINDNAGGAIIAWENGGSGSVDIYAQRVDGLGNILWNPSGVAVCTAGITQTKPRLVSDGSGGAIITWWDKRDDWKTDIYAQRINTSGSPLWTTNGVPVCTAEGSQDPPQIVSDGSGGAFITWSDSRNGSSIYSQHVDSLGNTTWTSDGILICSAAGGENSPQIVSDGLGGAIITWVDSRNGNEDIYAQRIDASGNTLWVTDGIPVCNAPNNQKEPKLVSDGLNGAIIAWRDYRSGNQDIYAQQVSSGGLLGQLGHIIMTMSVNGSGTTTPSIGSHWYSANTTVNITAAPSPNWEFVNWTGEVSDNTSASTNVTMDTNKTVTAHFNRVNSILRIAVSGSGSVTPALGNHTYSIGENVTITATPTTGWQFSGWTGDVADVSSASTNVSMDWDKTVIVSFTQIPVPTPAGGGGGGGGLGGLTNLLQHTTEEGKFVEDVTAPSGDEKVSIFIPRGTVCRNRAGSKLANILIREATDRPVPPLDAKVIGLVYDIQPGGAVFNPPVTLSFKYDVSQLPQGVGEKNLYIARWDPISSQWVKLESIISPETRTASTQIGHFSMYSVIAYPGPVQEPTQVPPTTTPAPAFFEVGALEILPDEVDVGENVTISIKVTNAGESSGSYEVVLKINGIVVDTKDVLLNAGTSREVTFTTAFATPGKRIIDVNGLIGGLTVRGEVPPPAQMPLPLEETTPTPEPVVTPSMPTPASPVGPTPTSRANWLLIGIIVSGGVIITGLLLYFTWWRKRHTSKPT